MQGNVIMDQNHKYIARGDGAQRARDILEKKIAAGRQSATGVFERVHSEAPADAIAKGKALLFDSQGEVFLNYGSNENQSIHKHALAQLATRAGVPSAYLAEMANSEEDWRRNLAAEILNRHYHAGATDERYLVRSVKGQVRGFLSDHYRRLDCRPLMERFIEKASALGAVPIDGTMSDTRVSLKAILPQIYEPVQGEVIAFGLDWSNSDFGNGKHAVRAFMLRVWCLNGATMENALGQVHLGRGISDDIELSARTYALDTRASVSALGDVIDATLAPKKIEALCAGIQRADENKVEWRDVRSALAKKLLKGELEAARNSFEGEDVYNLPAGKTMWRVSNAVSWLAGNTEDADRKLELQRLAGELVDGRADAITREAA